MFVGRNKGELQAYNATTGDLLWSFQTGAGANNTSTIFQQNGKEYIAFLAGGNSLAATPHGDNLWLFALDGTLGPAAAPGKGTGTQHGGEGGGKTTTSAAVKGNAAAGATVFANNCVSCHGADGHGGNGGPGPDGDPEREGLRHRGQAGRERGRRHAGVQGPADGQADRGRRDVRHAEDHEVGLACALVLVLVALMLALAVPAAHATTRPDLIVGVDVALRAKTVTLSSTAGAPRLLRRSSRCGTRRRAAASSRSPAARSPCPPRKFRYLAINFDVRGTYHYASRSAAGSSAIRGTFRVS